MEATDDIRILLVRLEDNETLGEDVKDTANVIKYNISVFLDHQQVIHFGESDKYFEVQSNGE